MSRPANRSDDCTSVTLGDDHPHRMVREHLPGVSLVIAVALFAHGLASFLPFANSLLVAIVIGVVITNSYGTPAFTENEVQLHKLFLEVGIVLMGARIVVNEFLAAGPLILALALATVCFGLVFVELFSRIVLDVDPETGALLAAGSCICGVSAIIATAGSIDPNEEQIAYAVGTILLFDSVTLVTFPVIGGLLDLPGRVFGIWAGLSMFSTGPVVAAGFAYSPVAGQWATVTKLVRNSLIGVVTIAYSFRYAHRSGETNGATLTEVWSEFPKFLVGFIVVMLIANSGFLSDSQLLTIDYLSDGMFLLAFAGLGFDIKAGEMKKTGLQPIILVLSYLVAIAASTLVLATLLF